MGREPVGVAAAAVGEARGGVGQAVAGGDVASMEVSQYAPPWRLGA